MGNQLKPVQRYRGETLRPRRPFWLPASNFYILAVASVVGVFFLLWGILQDGGEPTPWIAAGIAASGVLFGAVFLREVFLRSARNRFLANQRRLDRSLHGMFDSSPRVYDPNKLTLEKNSAILTEIRKKSEAAKVLGKFSEGHREVVDMCSEYLAAAERELPSVGVGSPRIAALHRGKDVANQVHQFHMLAWAEIEARTLTQDASNRVKVAERLESAQKAIGVVDFALNYYPQNANLRESKSLLAEFVVSIKISHMIEKAERANFKGNSTRALSHFRDALFFLDREAAEMSDRHSIEERIETEIRRILNSNPEIGIAGARKKSDKR